MIKYKLICKDCSNSFDSWFSSSKEYEKLKKLKHINCHKCNSSNVEKTLMSPSVFNSKKQSYKVTLLMKLAQFTIIIKSQKTYTEKLL